MAAKDVPALREFLARLARMDNQTGRAAAAVCVLLDRESYLTEPGTWTFGEHVDATSIDWDAVLAENWPHDVRFLLTTAAGLENENGYPLPVADLRLLDDGQYATWHAMLTAFRGEPQPADAPAAAGAAL